MATLKRVRALLPVPHVLLDQPPHGDERRSPPPPETDAECGPAAPAPAATAGAGVLGAAPYLSALPDNHWDGLLKRQRVAPHRPAAQKENAAEDGGAASEKPPAKSKSKASKKKKDKSKKKADVGAGAGAGAGAGMSAAAAAAAAAAGAAVGAAAGAGSAAPSAPAPPSPAVRNTLLAGVPGVPSPRVLERLADIVGDGWWDAPEIRALHPYDAPPSPEASQNPEPVQVPTRKRSHFALGRAGDELGSTGDVEDDDAAAAEGDLAADGAVADALASTSPGAFTHRRKRRPGLGEDPLDLLSPAQARSLLQAAGAREEALEQKLRVAARESFVLKKAVAIQAAQKKEMQTQLDDYSQQLRDAQVKLSNVERVNYQLLLHLRAADGLHNVGNPYGDVH